MKWRSFPIHAAGASLVELALVLPLLVLLVVGGSCLFVRNLYRDSLDEAAEQAAWTAARTGGDTVAIQSAVQRAIPFVPLGDLVVSATSAGYHAEVVVTVAYRGASIAGLPFFNAPLTAAQASATNQQERAFTVQLSGAPAAGASSAAAPASSPPLAAPGRTLGPAAWPSGPAALPGGR